MAATRKMNKEVGIKRYMDLGDLRGNINQIIAELERVKEAVAEQGYDPDHASINIDEVPTWGGGRETKVWVTVCVLETQEEADEREAKLYAAQVREKNIEYVMQERGVDRAEAIRYMEYLALRSQFEK